MFSICTWDFPPFPSLSKQLSIFVVIPLFSQCRTTACGGFFFRDEAEMIKFSFWSCHRVPCRSGIVVWFSVINTIRSKKSAEQRCFAFEKTGGKIQKILSDSMFLWNISQFYKLDGFYYIHYIWNLSEKREASILTCNIQNHTKQHNFHGKRKSLRNFQSSFLRHFSSFVCCTTLVKSNSFSEQRKQQSANNSNVYWSDYYWEPLKVIKTTWLYLAVSSSKR